MTNKLEISRELAEVFAGPRNYTPDQMRSAMDELRALLAAEPVPPLIQTLHANGDLIAAQATIAHQAQMIEHLRGGLTTGFTAVDMGTAAADGYRDGVASVEALRKNAERYQHLKATWHDGGLLVRLEANVLPEDWDSTIDADMGKEGCDGQIQDDQSVRH